MAKIGVGSDLCEAEAILMDAETPLVVACNDDGAVVGVVPEQRS